MKFKTLVIVAFCTIMVACNSNENNVVNRVELPGTIDENAFAANVESISVMNLEMDDWVFFDWTDIEIADNYIYAFVHKPMRLMCFDLQTGEKLSARTIKGNGPGEIIDFWSMFCIGDTLCVHGSKGTINKYDSNCRFLGKLHQFDNLYPQIVFRLNSGNYALVTLSGSDDSEPTTIILTDKLFNPISSHFKTPRNNLITFGGPEPCHANNDTVRLVYSFDNHIYSLCGEIEECLELAVPHPITSEIAIGLINKGTPHLIWKNYDGGFFFISESGRFLVFKYRLDGELYTAMLDKQTRRAVSIPSETAAPASVSAIINCFFRNAWLIKSDGRYIYVGIENHDLAEFFEADEKNLDDRLRKTLAEYRTYLQRNVEYIKGLDSDERDKVTIILKIKLKD